MSVSQVNKSTTPLAQAYPIRQQSRGDSASKKATLIFQKITDILLIILLVIQYAMNFFCTGDPGARERVFKGRVVCHTANQAKFSDLPEYVNLRRNPFIVNANYRLFLSRRGFSDPPTTFSPQAFSEGHCFGNVLVFLKQWLKTGDIEAVIDKFKGGSPIEGAIYQEEYINVFQDIDNPDMCELFQRIIDCYPLVSMAEERKNWLNKFSDQTLVILDAIEAYLKQGHHPKEGGFTEYVKTFILQNYGKSLVGKSLASVRTVAELYENKNLTEMELIQGVCARVGLSVEKFYHQNSSAEDVLNSLSNLGPGAYQLSIPVYNVYGKKVGSHAIGLVIETSGICYILDSNHSIGWTTKEKLVQTLGHLFTEYTGFDYSEDLKGATPSTWTKICNFLQERANPSSTPPIRFKLAKITEASP